MGSEPSHLGEEQAIRLPMASARSPIRGHCKEQTAKGLQLMACMRRTFIFSILPFRLYSHLRFFDAWAANLRQYFWLKQRVLAQAVPPQAGHLNHIQIQHILTTVREGRHARGNRHCSDPK